MCDTAKITSPLAELKLKLIKNNESGVTWRWELRWFGAHVPAQELLGCLQWDAPLGCCGMVFLSIFLVGVAFKMDQLPNLCYTNANASAREG